MPTLHGWGNMREAQKHARTAKAEGINGCSDLSGNASIVTGMDS